MRLTRLLTNQTSIISIPRRILPARTLTLKKSTEKTASTRSVPDRREIFRVVSRSSQLPRQKALTATESRNENPERNLLRKRPAPLPGVAEPESASNDTVIPCSAAPAAACVSCLNSSLKMRSLQCPRNQNLPRHCRSQPWC